MPFKPYYDREVGSWMGEGQTLISEAQAREMTDAWGSIGLGEQFGAAGSTGADAEFFIGDDGIEYARIGHSAPDFERRGIPVIKDAQRGNAVRADLYRSEQARQRQENASEGGITGYLNKGGGVGLVAGAMGPLAAATQLGGTSGLASSFSAPAGMTGAEIAAGGAANAASGAVGSFVDSPWAVNARGLTEAQIAEIVASEGGYSSLAPTAGWSSASGGLSLPPGISNIAGAVKRAFTGDGSGSDYATALGVGGGALALGGAVSGAFGGGATQTTSTNVPGMSAEERELIQLNAELTRRQLAAIDQLQPFQRQMLEMALAEMQRQQGEDAAISGAVSPEERATMARDEFLRAQRMGTAQDEITQIQLDNLRRNGAATPEQEALIKRATDSAIESAGYDIDAATSRGIGLIADELSNARGLRLSDSPMSSEAALLAREGVIQKGGVEKSLRANQANAQLNYPLAVTELSSRVSALPTQIAQSARDFQETLRQRAFSNRMAITGNATSTGLGLSSVNGGSGALAALTNNRLAGATQTINSNRGIGLSDVGNVASGVGNLIYGASRLF